MAPKKATASKAKTATSSSHGSYQDMIKNAIVNLKDRKGSSRQAIKKYIKANNDLGATTDAAFATHINRALAGGEKAGIFDRPKGPSGPVKLKKPEAAAAKPAAKPAVKAAPKKAAPKPAGEKKKAAPKKAAAKPKANTSTKKAPATESKPALTKTKTGRVTKAKAPAKKAAPKKAAPKKPAVKKAAPKKEAWVVYWIVSFRHVSFYVYEGDDMRDLSSHLSGMSDRFWVLLGCLDAGWGS